MVEPLGKKALAVKTTRVRDREQTEKLILKAATKLIAEKGFTAFGVNAVAKEAGVDKVLIYRYFGDLPGLVEQLGSRLDFWLGSAETVQASFQSYATFTTPVLLHYLRELRGNVLLQRLLAWELVQEDEHIQRLAKARSKAISTWFSKVSTSAPLPPKGVDAGAINAILIGAVHHLALRENIAAEFTGMDLSSPENWKRLEVAFEYIIHRVYSNNRDETKSKDLLIGLS